MILRLSNPSDIKKRFILDVLKRTGLRLETEYKGIPNRRFRFDYALPDQLIAIEYEGISVGGRHATPFGYTNDTRKYNLAALNGWVVLRYTALNYQEVENDITELLNIR